MFAQCKTGFPPRRPVGRFITRQVGRILTLAFLFLIAPCNLDCFPNFLFSFSMFAQCKTGFPLGGSCRVQRLMRGDKSAQQNITSPHKASAKPPPQRLPPSKQKNFPTEPRRKRKANQKFAPVMAGFCGEVLGVRGRLGGREGTLSRVPSLPPRSFPPRSFSPRSFPKIRSAL